MTKKSLWKKVPGFARSQALACFGNKEEPESYTPGHEISTDINEAHVITSQTAGDADMHRPILDIDFPAALIPSTTPGHFHLYLDKEIPWNTYADLIDALAHAGIIERGYADASVARAYTSVRLPWIRKKKPKEAAK